MNGIFLKAAVGVLMLAAMSCATANAQQDVPHPQGDPGPNSEVSDDDIATRQKPSGPAVDDRIRRLGGGVNVNQEDTPPVPVKPPETRNEQCTVKGTGGWFQPVQGVYQDDEAPMAAYDLDTKNVSRPEENPQLKELDRPGTYFARLPMIAGRDTVIMGVDNYRDRTGTKRLVGSHRVIVIKGVSDCATKRGVRMRFRLEEGSGTRELWTSSMLDSVPIEGPRLAKPLPFRIQLVTEDGVPPDNTFTFVGGALPYLLIADLVRADNGLPLNVRVSVGGPVVKPIPPVVKFVPLILDDEDTPAADLAAFSRWTEELAEASHRFIPDYYPLPPNSLPVFTIEPLNLQSLDPIYEKGGGRLTRVERMNKFQALVTRRLAISATMGGANRVIGLLRAKASIGNDYGRIVDPFSAAMTASSKVIFIQVDSGPEPRADGSPPTFEAVTLPASSNPGKITADIVDTVAHELAHSLPDFIWSFPDSESHNMMRDCGLNYHNQSQRVASGERLVIGGVAGERRNVDNTLEIMGKGSLTKQIWISQCTYAHLIAGMKFRPDPKLFLFSAIVDRFGGTPAATFAAGYDIDGTADAEPGPIVDWGIEVRDGAGALVAGYPVEPAWVTEENITRDAVTLTMQVQADPRAREVRVVYKGRTLASRRLAPVIPQLAVKAPAGRVLAAGAKVHVSWRAKSAEGGPLLASVLYSDNAGRWFNERLFETAATEADIALNPKATEHAIKVIVTDGGRSAEQVIYLRSR